MSEYRPSEQARKVVEQLGAILGPTAAKNYEETVQKAYNFPISTPLKKLRPLKILDDQNQTFHSKEPSVSGRTLLMRKELSRVLSTIPGPDEESSEAQVDKKVKIAHWIVSDWGGIRSGKPESLMACIVKAEREASAAESQAKSEDDAKATEGFTFERIASWSKYLAFKTPQKYAIYDARVIYSLNWLLYQSDCTPYFPFLTGQNSVMGLLDYQIHCFLKDEIPFDDIAEGLKNDIKNRRTPGKSSNSHFLSSLKKERPNLFISERAAFSTYCKLLNEIAKMLFPDQADDQLAKVEMLLFSIADAEIAVSVLEHHYSH